IALPTSLVELIAQRAAEIVLEQLGGGRSPWLTRQEAADYLRLPAQEITVDDVARLIAALQAEGKSGWTIRHVLTTLSSLLSWAVRRGLVPVNPVRQLERSERPKVARKRQCTFERDEIGKLVDAVAENYRPV